MKRFAAAIALHLSFVASVEAQTLRGVVVHTDSISPAQGLLVEVRGQKVGSTRTLTDARGQFTVSLLRPDSVRVRVLRIGYRPSEGTLLFVPDTGTTTRVVLEATAYNLGAVTVAGSSRCGRRANAEGYLLWDQALTALRTVDFTRRDPVLRIRTVEYEGPTTPDGVTRINTDSVLRLVPEIPPPPVVHYDSLFKLGYVRKNRGDSLMTYYAPDARVLTDDRFTPAYCFRLLTPNDSGPVRIRFEPLARRRVTDVEGTVFFDRGSLELQRIDFDFVQLPMGHNVRGAGGYIEFEKLRTGHWIIDEWMLRMAQHVIRLERCNVSVTGSYERPPAGGCAYLVRSSDGLWGRSQVVSDVVHGETRVYFNAYANALAQRAEAATRKR